MNTDAVVVVVTGSEVLGVELDAVVVVVTGSEVLGVELVLGAVVLDVVRGTLVLGVAVAVAGPEVLGTTSVTDETGALVLGVALGEVVCVVTGALEPTVLDAATEAGAVVLGATGAARTIGEVAVPDSGGVALDVGARTTGGRAGTADALRVLPRFEASPGFDPGSVVARVTGADPTGLTVDPLCPGAPSSVTA